MTTLEMTPEQKVVSDYKAALDSVALLQAGKPEDMDDADWADCVARNKAHLEIQIAKGAEYYGEHDLTPFKDAVK
jgi:exoribonuclease II